MYSGDSDLFMESNKKIKPKIQTIGFQLQSPLGHHDWYTLPWLKAM